MPIHLLPPDVISKIAAGEVIERPVSVVKELMENSLDAGASRIDVEITGGGVALIRVSDDGSGIPADEVELAFRPHATSKIETLADLDAASSLGFRGEALHSIAHVARVELLTRTEHDGTGTFLAVNEGTAVTRQAKAATKGTTIAVKGLFRNIPARLKFLKSASAEANQIANLVSQYGLGFPAVRFVLSIEGRETLSTPGSGRLKDAMAAIYGLDVARSVLEIEGGEPDSEASMAVAGCASPPSLSRATRGYMTFFVNRRWIQSRLLMGAVDRAYEGLLGVRRYPIAIINLAVSPASVDVNVHPAKREVRFSQESMVFNAVHGALRRALLRQPIVPEMKKAVTGEGFASYFAPFVPAPGTASVAGEATPVEYPSLPILRVIGQAFLTYILAEGPDGLYLVDQHAAHERVLFEKVLAEQSRRTAEVQPLLEPVTIDLSVSQERSLKTGNELLARFGFEVEPFGEHACLVRAVPAFLARKGIAEAFREVVDALDNADSGALREERVARSLACHGSIRAGQGLGMEEMRELLRLLENTASPRTCPHGRPTMVHVSAARLQREFGRA